MYKAWSVDDKQWGFELTQGPFEGVVVQVEDIKFLNVGETGKVEIDYHVIFMPVHFTESDIKGESFQVAINEVINKFMMDAIRDHEQN